MYLATSSPNGYRNYVNQDQNNNMNKNIQVCAGEFSGSDSSYQQYKSNCYSLMSEKCSTNWDQSCTSYVNNSNDKEAKLFLQNVKNSSKITVHPSNQMQISHQDQYNQYHQYHQDQYNHYQQYNQYHQYNPHHIRQSRQNQQQQQDQHQQNQHQQLQNIIQAQRPIIIKNTFIQENRNNMFISFRCRHSKCIYINMHIKTAIITYTLINQ
jgi:transcriptional regulator with GAF, ATPase, and Fis domain